jgi:hypothetical protein
VSVLTVKRQAKRSRVHMAGESSLLWWICAAAVVAEGLLASILLGFTWELEGKGLVRGPALSAALSGGVLTR